MVLLVTKKLTDQFMKITVFINGSQGMTINPLYTKHFLTELRSETTQN